MKTPWPWPGRLARLVLAACAAVLIAACSLPRLAYNNVDWLLMERIDDHVELTFQQRAELSEALEKRLEVHRKKELPTIAEALDRAVVLIGTGLDSEGAVWLVQTASDLTKQSLALFLPDVAVTLSRLDESQQEYLREQLGLGVSRLENEYAINGALEDRQERRTERTIDYLEEFVGNTSEPQRALVKQYMVQMPDSLGLWVSYLRARHAELLVRIARGEPAPALSAYLRRSFVDLVDMDTRLKEMRESRRTLVAELLLAVDRSLNAEQRERAVDRLAALAEDARALIAEGS